MRALIVPALVLVAGGFIASCSESEEPKSSTRLLIVTGRPFRVFHPLGEALAAIYAAEMPSVAPSVQSTTGSVSNVRALQDGDAELGFAQSDVAYDAFHHGTVDDPKKYQNLRAIAALYVSAIHIVVPRDGPIRNLADLQGKRLAVGPETGGAQTASNVILEVQGIGDRVLRETVDLENEASRLRAGELDAGVIVASYPVAAVTHLNSSVGIRLLEVNLEIAAAVRQRYPFFRPIVIPDGVYENQGGSVRTVTFLSAGPIFRTSWCMPSHASSLSRLANSRDSYRQRLRSIPNRHPPRRYPCIQVRPCIIASASSFHS
jgi:TRAP transporter TAXI family solute receptor